MALIDDIINAIFKLVCCDNGNDDLPALEPVHYGGPIQIITPRPTLTPTMRSVPSVHSSRGIGHDSLRGVGSPPTYVGHERRYPAINVGSGENMLRIPSGSHFF
jgi:hypothetical protein